MKSKTISWLLDSPENFEFLLEKLILWPEGSKNFHLSGLCTAAILEPTDLHALLTEEGKSIIAINTWDDWHTFYLTREDIITFLSDNPEIVGDSEEETYQLSYE